MDNFNKESININADHYFSNNKLVDDINNNLQKAKSPCNNNASIGNIASNFKHETYSMINNTPPVITDISNQNPFNRIT